MSAWVIALCALLLVESFCVGQDFNVTTRDPFTDSPTSIVTNFVMTSSGPQMSVTGTSLPIIGTSSSGTGKELIDYGDEPIPLYIIGLFPVSDDKFHRGPSARIASQLALEHINNRTDVLPGYEMKMSWIDTKVKINSWGTRRFVIWGQRQQLSTYRPCLYQSVGCDLFWSRVVWNEDCGVWRSTLLT